ncbi:MAG: DUF1211 domain-containing protein [Armatimonadetes bacterium]|nr:DUF1211 domain-containing protein [Armatimonadota bacterium]
MTKSRIEAFSDGVLAIIITIMVLELRPPKGASLHDLAELAPEFLSYLLSFIYIGIYWNNHHHLMHVVRHVNGKVMWANMHLLFWLSVVPFVTAWMGSSGYQSVPVFVYGIPLLLSGVAYYILCLALKGADVPDSPVARAIGRDQKGLLSLGIYAFAVAVALFSKWVAVGCYALVAVMWWIPDRRIERVLHDPEGHAKP